MAKINKLQIDGATIFDLTGDSVLSEQNATEPVSSTLIYSPSATTPIYVHDRNNNKIIGSMSSTALAEITFSDTSSSTPAATINAGSNEQYINFSGGFIPAGTIKVTSDGSVVSQALTISAATLNTQIKPDSAHNYLSSVTLAPTLTLAVQNSTSGTISVRAYDGASTSTYQITNAGRWKFATLATPTVSINSSTLSRSSVDCGALTLNTPTFTIANKTRIAVTPTTSTGFTLPYYIVVQPNAAAGSPTAVTATINANATAAIAEQGYAKSELTKSAATTITTTLTIAAANKTGSNYYLPIAAGAVTYAASSTPIAATVTPTATVEAVSDGNIGLGSVTTTIPQTTPYIKVTGGAGAATGTAASQQCGTITNTAGYITGSTTSVSATIQATSTACTTTMYYPIDLKLTSGRSNLTVDEAVIPSSDYNGFSDFTLPHNGTVYVPGGKTINLVFNAASGSVGRVYIDGTYNTAQSSAVHIGKSTLSYLGFLSINGGTLNTLTNNKTVTLFNNYANIGEIKNGSPGQSGSSPVIGKITNATGSTISTIDNAGRISTINNASTISTIKNGYTETDGNGGTVVHTGLISNIENNVGSTLTISNNAGGMVRSFTNYGKQTAGSTIPAGRMWYLENNGNIDTFKNVGSVDVFENFGNVNIRHRAGSQISFVVPEGGFVSSSTPIMNHVGGTPGIAINCAATPVGTLSAIGLDGMVQLATHRLIEDGRWASWVNEAYDATWINWKALKPYLDFTGTADDQKNIWFSGGLSSPEKSSITKITFSLERPNGRTYHSDYPNIQLVCKGIRANDSNYIASASMNNNTAEVSCNGLAGQVLVFVYCTWPDTMLADDRRCVGILKMQLHVQGGSLSFSSNTVGIDFDKKLNTLDSYEPWCTCMLLNVTVPNTIKETTPVTVYPYLLAK